MIIVRGCPNLHLDWKKNLGDTDRIIRLIAGLILTSLVITKTITGWWAAAAVIISILQFVQAYSGY